MIENRCSNNHSPPWNGKYHMLQRIKIGSTYSLAEEYQIKCVIRSVIMRISVIIPCYNVNEVYFEECLLSIKKQSFKDYELIIIDDGSDFAHASATKSALNSIIPKGRYYYQENQGASVARNNALMYAQGDYVCFIDADDVIVPGFLEEASIIATKTSADYVIGGIGEYTNNLSINDNKIVYCCLSDIQKENFKANMIGTIKRFENKIGYYGRGPVARLIRRSIAEQTPFDSKLVICEDVVWNLELLNKVDKVVIVERVWYKYRYNPCSVNHQPNKNAIRIAEDGLNTIAKHMDYQNDIIFSSYCKRIIQDFHRVYYTFLSNNYIKMCPKKRKRIIKTMFKRKPWSEIKSYRAIKTLDNRYRIRRILLLYGGDYYMMIKGLLKKRF